MALETLLLDRRARAHGQVLVVGKGACKEGEHLVHAAALEVGEGREFLRRAEDNWPLLACRLRAGLEECRPHELHAAKCKHGREEHRVSVRSEREYFNEV